MFAKYEFSTTDDAVKAMAKAEVYVTDRNPSFMPLAFQKQKLSEDNKVRRKATKFK